MAHFPLFDMNGEGLFSKENKICPQSPNIK